MTTRTLTISGITVRVVDALRLMGVKQDMSSDPAAPSPGTAFRLYVESLEPMHDAQGDGEQEVFRAAMSLVVTTQTSGGNRAQSSIDLAQVAENVANMTKNLHTEYGDMDISWTDARLFIGDGDVTKLAMSLTVDY